MDARETLIDGIGRSRETCHRVLEGLDADALAWRPAADANTIAWLVWHLARQQDAQVAHLAGCEEVWTAGGWFDRFGLDLPASSLGYGHTAAEAAKVRVTDLSLLLGYLDAATDATAAYVSGLDPASLDDIVDTRWTPHVTRGVRLVSVVDDAAQHAGQAAYVRGLYLGQR